MTHKALIRRLQISCLGLDPIDPLRLLVDDVIEALAQPQRTWVGLTDDEIYRIAFELEGEHWRKIADAIEAKLKEKNA
jgi:hypothetical protein